MSNEMQEYDFKTIINKWQSLSSLHKDNGNSKIARKESGFTKSRSKDSMSSSSSQDCIRRKDEGLDSLIPVHDLQASSSVTSTGLDAAIASEPSLELINQDNGGEKVAAGDSCNKKDEIAFISVKENDPETNTTQPQRANNKAKGDNVDSVSPTTHTPRSAASKSEENCAVNCLHYTLQCSDCAIM